MTDNTARVYYNLRTVYRYSVLYDDERRQGRCSGCYEMKERHDERNKGKKGGL
jgi:hypothetical protein